jgi:hypothetical protein
VFPLGIARVKELPRTAVGVRQHVQRQRIDRLARRAEIDPVSYAFHIAWGPLDRTTRTIRQTRLEGLAPGANRLPLRATDAKELCEVVKR